MKCDIVSVTESFQKERFLPLPEESVAMEALGNKIGSRIRALTTAASQEANIKLKYSAS